MSSTGAYIRWLEEHKPGTAQWIARRGGWDKLSRHAKRAIKQQVREARRKLVASLAEPAPKPKPGQVIWGDSWDEIDSPWSSVVVQFE
jgi:hypothetical protein